MRLGSRWAPTLVICFIASLLLVPQVLAQNPTGGLTGVVTGPDGSALPGVTITATSPSLQGSRVNTTSGNGSYKLAFLPPGTYTVTYELESFATSSREIRISAASQQTSDIQMQLDTVAEEIVVTGRVDVIADSTTGSSTVGQDELEKLPVSRNLTQAILLSPGISTNGVSGTPSISGAMSFENLWLINGVVINENVRGQILNLFIEDAIQETTTAVSGVSAEYGRFTGGVVNAITKSGGNEFSGSVRVSLTNDDWTSDTPLTTAAATDKTNDILEGTLGGYFYKDHVWFFAAGRDRTLSRTDQTNLTNIGFSVDDEETRVEGKLTLTPHPSHSLLGSYIDIDRVRTNGGFGTFIDLASLSDRTDPQEIKSVNYTGILTSNFFLEAQYSERAFPIAGGSGGPQDQILGTLMRNRGTGFRYFAPTFCGSCEQRSRDNENALVKGSYFLSTDSAGSHDFVAGFDTFDDIVFSINHQTGSDFTVWSSDILIDSQNNIFPVINNSSAWIGWWAVFNTDLAKPTSFTTNSFYVNDRWQLNDKWSFNLGARFDQNDGSNSAGVKVADDSKVSPRLGLTYDVKGDGDLQINASVGTYVAAILNSGNVADSTSNGGAIGLFLSSYGGPQFNLDPNCINTGSCTNTETALQGLFNWYFGNGGTTDLNDDLSGIPGLFYSSIPGVTSVVPGSFSSPSADEITIGAAKRLGNKGLFRVDLIYRDWTDFYSNLTTLGTGTVQTPAGLADQTFVGNFGNSDLRREYTGINSQFRYRLTDRFTLAGNYTLSKTEGNINGETGVNGPVPSSPNSYPEYKEARWNTPDGDLVTDQRHRLRAWAIYDIFNTERNNLSVSLLQNFSSGEAYSAIGAVDSFPFVGDIGYANVPTPFNYFYSERGAFKTDDITRTDLSFNYSFRWNAWGKALEVFIQPEIINLFDEDGVTDVNNDVEDATTDGDLATFNPFTTTPTEGVHFRLGEDFGQPINDNDFQPSRTWRFSVGFRF